jgi:hypothetical protein
MRGGGECFRGKAYEGGQGGKKDLKQDIATD